METVNPTARSAFAITAVVTLLIGLYMFFFPATLATLPAPANAANPWPWLIGPLAMRLLGATLIAFSVTAGLVAMRPDRPTLLAFTTSEAIAGGIFLLHILLNTGQIDWTRPLAWIWADAVVAALVASLLTLRWLRSIPTRTVPPLPPTPPVVNWIALVFGAATGLVGAMMFFFPDIGRARWPWDLGSNVTVQLFGALFLTVSAVAFWSWRQPSWYGYDLIYPGAATFSVVALTAALLHWGLFDMQRLGTWIFVVAYIVGGVFGYYPYVRYSLGRGARVVAQRV
ncbi:MAG TPA: hypothetical protein VFU22_26405 [Roseiflexaceae bacterium]|nr:hypothetical protein [Roseiflexaceae bacterium]